MNVLLTMPFGSRLYGTFDENSDWDWKKLVLPEIEDLLVGVPIKNKFFSSASDTVKNTSDDTDTEIIHLQTFARDVLAGQTYALEMMFAVLKGPRHIKGMELHDDRLQTFCGVLYDEFLTSNINAMVGYAYHQAELYSDKGNRLDKLHQFEALLREAMIKVPMTKESKLEVLIGRPELWEPMVDKMFYLTEAPNPDGSVQICFNLLEKLYPEGITILEAQKRVNSHISKYGRRANQAMENKGKDWKAISHAVRVTMEAVSVLQNKWMELPFYQDEIELLKKIKYGLMPWEEVQPILVGNIDKLAVLQRDCNLPVSSPELNAKFEAWLREEMMYFYGVRK
jgi:hypothetical protein